MVVRKPTTATTVKYLAVKLKGLNHFVWFERQKTKQAQGQFAGQGGWGARGVATNIQCQVSAVEAWIYSEELQYI